MRRYKGLIFDFNGVLLLDQHLHDTVWKQIARDVTGREPSDTEFKENWHGRSNDALLSQVYDRELTPHELDTFAKEKELTYQKVAREQGSEYALAEGAISLFEDLKTRGVPFTIGTSSPPMNVAFFDGTLGLRAWFDMKKVACGDGTVRGKPAPDIYLKAAKMLDLPPSDCIVIEDAQLGIEAARSAGIGHIIAIGPRQEHERLARIRGVSEVIEKLTEVDVDRLFI